MNTIKSFLVGGAVRDMLLGLEPKDCDYVVIGSTVEQMLNAGFKEVGADFPVFLHPETNEEYALARSEKKIGPGYRGFSVEFSPDITLEDDLFRRDLTINAMAIDDNGDVIDPYGGLIDLKNKVLRHTSTAFQEDPVRVLRLARFAARYSDFTVHEDTMLLMRHMVDSGSLNSLVPERVYAEFSKGLMEDNPSRMFSILIEIGAAMSFFEFMNYHPLRLTALSVAALNGAEKETRFAIVASGFRSAIDFKKWTISSDCEEVATLVNNNIFSISRYDTLTSEERVQFFNRCDARRRTDRFRKMLDASRYILEYASRPSPTNYPLDIDVDWNLISQVDGGKIAASIKDKTKIKDAIFEAQCNVISTRAAVYLTKSI